MPLGQIESLRFVSESNRDILRRPPKLSHRRLSLALFNIFRIHVAHTLDQFMNASDALK